MRAPPMRPHGFSPTHAHPTAPHPLHIQIQAAPFASLFQAYCATALTHIADDVRLDAVAALGMWMQRFPDQMFRLRAKVQVDARSQRARHGGVLTGHAPIRADTVLAGTALREHALQWPDGVF